MIHAIVLALLSRVSNGVSGRIIGVRKPAGESYRLSVKEIVIITGIRQKTVVGEG